MFAALQLERDPLKITNLPALLFSWVQDVGGFAAAGLAVWLVYRLAARSQTLAGRAASSGKTASGQAPSAFGSPRSRLITSLFAGLMAGTFLAYLILGILHVPDLVRWMSATGPSARVLSPIRDLLEQILLAVGGGCAILAVTLPILADLPRLSPRRIWALAKLSFKEAIRRRVVWAFAALLLVFLFASWFIDTKPEQQVRTYVGVVTLVMTLLLLVTAGLLAAFSIPTDVRNQTIHTILTKPVERFEVVLGRFLGFTMLMTLILGAATLLSLLYVLRGIDPDAAEESLKARVPLFGELRFEGTADPTKGESVGREWEYRGYITGPNPPQPTQYGIYAFAALPAGLANREQVRGEYTFDIFRTTKGADDKAITCTLLFETWRFREEDRSRYNNERNQLRQSANAEPVEVIDARLAEKYGYYEAASVPVVDYHTLAIDIPATLFRNALGDDEARRQELRASGQPVVPLRVRVRCEDRTQYVGMAKYDFYFRADDHTSKADRLWFSWNFFKGAAGLWFWLCLVIGLAVALSTYLTGVISFLCGAFLFVAGFFREFIQNLAQGTNVGGGPTESALRLFKGANMVTPLEDTAAARVASSTDTAFRWVLRRFLNVLPDVDQFSLTGYVAEGFNVSGGQLFMNLVLLIGYLLPWAVLAYYMMRSREVASSS